MPKHSLVIAHYRPDIVSGAENSIADFVSESSGRFHITMLVPGKGSLASFYQDRGFNVWVRSVQTPRRLFPGLHTIQSLFLARELKNQGAHAILCNTLPSASRVMSAARMAGLPTAIYMRDYIANTPHNRRLLEQAAAIFAISKDVKRHIDQMTSPERVYLAYNYIEPGPIIARHHAHKNSGQRLLPFSPDHPVVGLVGRITPYKQPDLFIRAIPHVLQAVPQARFVVVGAAQKREQPYEEQVKAIARELNVEQQVAFLGQRPDTIELTSEFTVSCLASGREPLGRVILESHLVNTAVVVPDTGGPAEIVLDEFTGLHFSSGAKDAEVQLARQIIRLLENGELRKCLAGKARERVMNTFANRKHVQIQEDYFEKLCSRKL